MLKLFSRYLIIQFFFNSITFGQIDDSKSFNLIELESEFLTKNYQLLAEKYNIDVATAAILQSKLWNNPTLSISQVNLWRNSSAESLPYLIDKYGNHQQFAFDIEQVIETAGKRRKRVALKTAEKDLVIIDFENLVRELKLQLRTSYFELHQLTQEKEQLNTLTSYYEELSNLFQKQAEKQVFNKAEFYRVQTALLGVKKQLTDLLTNESFALEQLRILTQRPELEVSQLRFNELLQPDLSSKIPINIIDLIKDSSNLKKQALQQLLISEQTVNLEKANGKPNLQLLMGYDRGGSIMRDFVGFGIGIDLPIYNRNQGNIKIAQAQFEQQKINLLSIDIQLETTVNRLITQVQLYEKMLKEFPSSSLSEFKEMMDNYIKHLKSKQVSLFEFIDFSGAYIDAQNQYYELQKNYLNTFEELQLLIGKDL